MFPTTPTPDAGLLVAGAPIESPAALVLPSPPPPPRRPPFPVIAVIAPIIVAVAIWLITGSMMGLWFAALGPLIAVGTVVDGMRAGRRDRRRAAVERETVLTRTGQTIDERHREEVAVRRKRHPDVARSASSEGEIWRSVPGRDDLLVLGKGRGASTMQVVGGEGDPQSDALRARAAILDDAPVTVRLTAGVAVMGPSVPAAAVVRALVAQVCLVHPPGSVRLVGRATGENGWMARLPHRSATSGLRLGVGSPEIPLPADVNIAIVRVEPDIPPPPRCAAQLTLLGVDRARLDIGGESRIIGIEALAHDQAEELAHVLGQRATAVHGADRAAAAVALGPLLEAAPAPRSGMLAAVIGADAGDPVVVDLVGDGPHAVVAGVTGSGKSELLTTWVTSLAATHSCDEVVFLLVDFKGGTTFDGLRRLPHVTGVVSDLDESSAQRAIESLRAEVRRREAALAAVGARDVSEPGVGLPRLVVVVDEFAAMISALPDLQAVFVDVAARGRALGIHLILGTQRVSGVVRDAVLTNCPLRLSLRVTDAADSRAVVGADDASRLPGGDAGRGLAVLRRGSDAFAQIVRIALTAPETIALVVSRHADATPPRPVWLTPLPRRIRLDDVHAPRDVRALILGIADEPEMQRQSVVSLETADRGLLIVGGPGTGKSSALRLIEEQARNPVPLPDDAEGLWDALARWDSEPPSAGSVLLLDDLDTVAGRFSPEYSAIVMQRWERLVRRAGQMQVLIVAATQRLSGPVGRSAELFPRRLILSVPTRADQLAAGGEPAHHRGPLPPGRGRLDGTVLQLALPRTTSAPSTPPVRTSQPPWTAFPGLTGLVAPRASSAGPVSAAVDGVETMPVEVALAALPDLELEQPDRRVLIWGDPDAWLRTPRLLALVRRSGGLVIDSLCAADYRALSADRELPPWCDPGAGGGWLLREGDAVRRVRVHSGMPSAHRRDGRP